MDKILPHVRRKQMFQLLAEHGPLSRRGLKACLYPPIEQRRLYEVIKRLLSGGLIVKRHYKSLGKDAQYYQLTQQPEQLEKVAKVLGVNFGELRQPHFSRIEMFHSETCAVWKELLKHLFPEARILREHEFYGDEQVSKLLLARGEDNETRPDLLIIAKSKVAYGSVTVAVEIEKNPKSRVRLLRKLIKYATQSRLDGIIYVCEDTSLSDRLLNIYNSRVLDGALRIKHYGNNFFLFTDGTINLERTEPRMFNAALEPVSLINWITKLLNIEARSRRDAKF